MTDTPQFPEPEEGAPRPLEDEFLEPTFESEAALELTGLDLDDASSDDDEEQFNSFVVEPLLFREDNEKRHSL